MDPLFRWIIAGVFLVGSPFSAIGVYEAYQTSAELRDGSRLLGNVVGNRLVVDQRDGIEERAYCRGVVPVAGRRRAPLHGRSRQLAPGLRGR